jgi:hypothetical protein
VTDVSCEPHRPTLPARPGWGPGPPRLVGSMGQVGSAGDNAAMESFFALLQRNVLDRRRWTTRDQLRVAIVT